MTSFSISDASFNEKMSGFEFLICITVQTNVDWIYKVSGICVLLTLEIFVFSYQNSNLVALCSATTQNGKG